MVGRSAFPLLALAALLVGAEALGYANGVVGYSGKTAGASCSSCHSPNTAIAAPTVVISGPATLAPGASGSYTLRITGGPGIRGGMNVAADVTGAVLRSDSATTQASAGEITHSAARLFSGGSVTFAFSMVAPSTAGVVKLFGVGNSCNNAGGSSGDREALTTFNVNVTSGNAAPTLATPAAASPAVVSGSTSALSVLGADDNGESALLYTWSATGLPAPAFTLNGTNAAKNTVATFTRAGSYTFTVTVRDAAGLSVTSVAPVTVQASLASIQVAPGTIGLAPGRTQQFTASGVDQFGQALAANATWTVSGGGTISSTGLFTAGATPGGPFLVTATAGGKTASAQVTISAGAPPTIAQAAAAAVNPVVGKAVALSVLGADDGGAAALSYTWAAIGAPGPVSFSANGTNAARAVTATFTRAGSYGFTVTVRDAPGLSVTSSVTVVVEATAAGLTVSPATTTVGLRGTAQLAVAGVDQFGAPLASPPVAVWSASGGGTINTSGLFTAGASAGGPFTVTASAAGLQATAQVTVSAASAPSFAQSPTAQPAVVLGRSTSLRVLGADSGGEAGLSYHWSATGPAPAAFSPNDSNAAKNSTLTFTVAGVYQVSAEVKNAAGVTARSQLEVTVEQTLTGLAVEPATATIGSGGVQQFRAPQADQFGAPMSIPADVSWTVAGTGTIGADGVYQAPVVAGGPWLVTGTSSTGVRGTALITVGAGSPTVDAVAPTVSVMSVTAGTELTGAVVVRAEVSDAVGIALAELQLDGKTIATRTSAPWEFVLDSTQFPNGGHALELIAHDAAGNTGRTPTISIEIKNPIEQLGTVSGDTELAGCSAGPGALLIALGLLAPALLRRRRAPTHGP